MLLLTKLQRVIVALAFIGGLVVEPATAQEETTTETHPNIEISGLLDTGLAFSSEKMAGHTQKSSDSTLNTMELNFDSKLTDKVRGHIGFLYKDGVTAFRFNEGTITLGGGQGLEFSMGTMYVPFGEFSTNMISDPLTLTMGETRDSAALLTYNAGAVSASLYLFSGEIHKTDIENKLEHRGFRIAYDKGPISVGLDYINSIAESEVLREKLIDTSALDQPSYLNIDTFVGGTAFHANYRTERFNILVERVAALKTFADTASTDGELAGSKPITNNVEFGYRFGENNIAISLQGSKEAESFAPKRRVLLGYAREILEKVGLKIELAKTTQYNADHTDMTLSVQTSIEF